MLHVIKLAHSKPHYAHSGHSIIQHISAQHAIELEEQVGWCCCVACARAIELKEQVGGCFCVACARAIELAGERVLLCGLCPRN